MPHGPDVTVSGVIADVFAHRFVLETAEGRVLADLTPKGAERVALVPGSRVTISGERKPSEIKVSRFTPESGEPVTIEAGKPHDGEDADTGLAVRTAEEGGYSVLAPPRRKPKHWEVLVRDAGGQLRELHIELDGTLRKAKDADPAKWPDAAVEPDSESVEPIRP